MALWPAPAQRAHAHEAVATAAELSLTHGELVISRGLLSPLWLQYRFCTCGWVLGPYSLLTCWLPLYALCGRASREEERRSFTLLLTSTAIVYQHKLYR